jgi:hypothetical protein
MAMTQGVIIVSLGPRRGMVKALVENLRHYTNLPIALVTDVCHDYVDTLQVTEIHIDRNTLKWLDSPRWGVRNCNVLSAQTAMDLFDSCCVLNDDMRVVHKDAIPDGIAMAERFGTAVPINPRIYVRLNAMGTDAGNHDYCPRADGPGNAPACNVSPLFVCRHHNNAKALISQYLQELETCMRGTLAFWKASWHSGVSPVYLPEQWCVCGSSAKHIRDYKKPLQGRTIPVEPMMLHWGQQEVRDVFKGIA